MDPTRHRRATEVFLEACDLASEEREVFLNQACAGDPDLRREVESLLLHDERVPLALNAESVHVQVRARVEAVSAPQKAGHRPSEIGSYRILGILGEGSQGVVFKAEQQTPRRLVALKVLRGGPFLGKHGARRFEREIQALAAFRHPGIATIYEAKHTEDGQYFFSMELVEGLRIDEFVRQKSFTVRERLELFGRVCNAVQHAHEKGVIHRDLKPSNILVDGHGKPKILDFGLVRMLERDAKLGSTDLGTGGVVGSLGYMSPEQAQGRTEEIGPPTDVYSLGVILYELLTGRSPYDVGDSLAEAVLTICQTPPLRPSAINRRLRGDLDTIILRALEKEPSLRFPSVAELVADIRRYLEGAPITARPPAKLYLLRKKLCRHPVGAAIGAAVIGLTVVGLCTGYWLNQREYAAARMMALSMLRSVEMGDLTEHQRGTAQSLSDRYPNLPDASLAWAHTRLRGDSAATAISVLEGCLRRDPSQWPARLLMAEIYRQLGELSRADELNEKAEADAPDTVDSLYLRSISTLDPSRAMKNAENALQRDPRHVLALARVAYLSELAGDFDRALDVADALIAQGDEFRWMKFQGDVLVKQGRYDSAVEKYREAMTTASTPFDRANALFAAGVAYLLWEKHDRAVRAYTEAIALTSHLDVRWLLYQRATSLWILGRLSDAAADYEEFRTVYLRPSYADARLFLVRHQKARVLDRQGHASEAQRVLKQATEDLRLARQAVAVGSWLVKIFECLDGDRTVEDLIAAADGTDPEQVCEAYYYAAEMCLVNGKVEQARRFFQKCVETGLRFDPDQAHPDPMNEYHLARWRLKELSRRSEGPGDGDAVETLVGGRGSRSLGPKPGSGIDLPARSVRFGRRRGSARRRASTGRENLRSGPAGGYATEEECKAEYLAAVRT